ncbi:hypothetical protein LINGRAHAP2_LOCUS12296 [Linum grandiflorum]
MWHKNREYCPKGTVAILRSSRTDIPPKNRYERKAFNTAADAKIPTGFHSEYVTASLPGREHYGINADINIWDPQVEPNEVSLAQLSVTDGGGDNIESIDAGWMDIKTRNWWLTVTGIEVGYWPGELFTNLKGSAALLEWGGQVVSSKPDTTTQMGSGHFPNEGYGKAAWFRNLEFVDGNGFFNPSGDVEGHASRPECYDIQSGDETIDCVDIYKQPAFNHPLLKNHTVQLKPSSYPVGSKSKVPVNSTEHTQTWHMNGDYCPNGTVAILRSSMTDIPPKNTYDLKAFNNTVSNSVTTSQHEHAVGFVEGSNYYGANADINVWNPRVQPNEISIAQIWVADMGGEKIETVEAGWMITPSKPEPSIFTFWTSDGYKTTGCYDMHCSGFVQTSSKIALGARISPVSTYGGKQFFVNIKIHQDIKTGNWWFSFQGKNVGYWPASLFKNLKGPARLIEWGGEVVNKDPKGIHTTTQMGSGHFPREGSGKAAWFKNVEYKAGNGFFTPADDIGGYATRPECYDIAVSKRRKEFGVYFFYGGPGYSPSCQK